MMPRLLPAALLVLSAWTLGACRGAEAPGPEARPGVEEPARSPSRSSTPGRRLPASGLVSPQELERWLALPDAPLLVDVRTQAEFDTGHVPGALGIPVHELSRRLSEIAGGRERGVIVYGRSGRRSRSALGILQSAGFADTARLDGDVLRWEAEGRPLEIPEPD